jgi:L-ascorbate metabolism protein UlaG (beta-lactamase superfamily)
VEGSNLVYLKSNVIAEPLFAGWYAWPHLISPASCAMNIVGRHLKIMNSYIQSPQVHAAAVKNPAMLGGPFIDYATNRATEVALLRDKTLNEQAVLIDFAQAIQQLTRLLKEEATGFSLDPLYEKVPAPLQGYIELFYDLQNHPSFRLYEALLYRSPFYQPAAQSVLLTTADTDQRAFVLSTPRLPGEATINIEKSFAEPAYDELFQMRRTSGSYESVREALAISGSKEPLFRSFFTESKPRPAERYQGAGLRVRYFGHACLVLETKDVCVMSDPLVSQQYEGAMPRFTLEDLPSVIDYVVITHGHQDHVLLETLLQLRKSIRNVVVPRSSSGELQDPSLKLILKAVGFPNVIELEEFDSIEVPGGRITGLPFLGEHADLHIHSKLCHHVALGGYAVLLAADSCAVDQKIYEHVHDLVGDVDALFLGMECDGAPLSWLYGPLLSEPLRRDQDRSRKLSGSNFPRAIGVVERFKPREVYVYAMGMEPWMKHISSLQHTDTSAPIVESNKLVNECRNRGIVAERLFGMKELIYETKQTTDGGR